MNKSGIEIIVRELNGFEEIRTIFPLISQLNPDITETEFLERLKVMLCEGYRCIGAFSAPVFNTGAGFMLGCAGFWVGTRLWCGKFIEPDNLVVNRQHRGCGVGDKLMEWIEEEGKTHNCHIVKLEAYAVNTNARAFYVRKSYEEPGIVIVKPLMVDSEEWREKLNIRAK